MRIFPEEESQTHPSVDCLLIDISNAARMDIYNTDELDCGPLGPEDDHMAGLLTIDISTAERREANEIVELFLTFGAELPAARAQVAEFY